MIILVFFIAHWYLSLFAQSFLAHRYAAHGAFTMNKFWERFFYIFAYITMGSSYMSPRAYAIMHRMHHAYTDTPNDPHSPEHFSNLFSMMFHTAKTFASIYKKTAIVEDRFLKNLTDWPALDKLGQSALSRILCGACYVAFYYFFAPSLWWYLLLPIHFVMGPVHGAIINWFAHKYGSFNFKLSNTSRNLIPVDILMLGEAYHNNHHKFASNINFGHNRCEIDPVYFIARIFNRIGIIKLRQVTAE